MVKLEYGEQFKEASKLFTLFGNKLLVERVELGELKTAGGLILAESSHARADLKMSIPHVASVLAVGQGYYDAEKNEYLPLEVKTGNVIILNSMGVQYYKTLPGSPSYVNSTVGITTEADVQMKFDDMEAFLQYVKVMGGKLS